MARALRNIAIIALLALAVAAVPGGGGVARGFLTALTIAFLAALAFAAYRFYLRNRLAFVALSDRQRTMMLVALGAIALMVAGAQDMLDSGVGTLIWIGAIAAAALALYRVWVEARSY